MKKMKPSLGNYFKLPNPGLRAYFKHNEDGNPEDYRPPFWNKMDRSKVLELWQAQLDSSGMKSKYPEMYQFEMDMKAKVGPLSIQAPLSDRLESIEQYYTCIEKPGIPFASEAISATVKFFSAAGGIRLRSRMETVRNMRLSTNSGSWLFTKRKNVVKDTLEYYIFQMPSLDDVAKPIKISNDRLGRSVQPDYFLAAVLGWRGQEGGISSDDVKQRVVWMMPFLLNVEELQFYQPAIESIQKHGLIPAYVSMDAVDNEVTALFDTKGADDLVVCTDFTKFDQHFNKHWQDAAFQVIKELLTPGMYGEDWLRRIFPIKFRIPLICSENLMYSGPHGMGSGSGGTNFDECLAHKVAQFESALDNHSILNPHSMAYGDDGILTYPGITVDQVVQAYTKHGVEMNATKQYASKHDCVVLRRWHGMNYRVNGTMVGVYSTFRALGRLLGQERFYDPEKWSDKMVTLRALSILENCKWSPVFHQFIDFVLNGDKLKLGLAIPGFFDDLEGLASKAIEQFTDFLGYTKTLQDDAKQNTTGINDWEVVKYLKSKIK